MGTTPRLRHEDKGPLHHSRTEDLRPFGTGMAEPLRTPIFHIADILGWSATIATPGPQRNIRRAGVGPEQDRYDPGPRMGIDFARLPPREGKATPGFLWREAKQRASRRRLPPVVRAHSHASSAPSQARLLYPEASGILRRLPHTGGCLPGYRARTPWRPRRLPAVPERERHSPHRGWIIGRRTTVSRSDTPPLIVTMRSPWTCPAPQAVVWPPLPVQATRAALGTGRPELDRRLHCAVHCRHTTLLLLTAVALCPAAFAGEPFPWHAFKRSLTIASPSCPSPPCSIPHDRARMRVVYAVS
jgi:hypothetical protein